MIDTNIPAVNTSQSQPQFRDRLFKAIFGRNTEQSKRWRLDLYNALNNSTYTDPDALELISKSLHMSEDKVRELVKDVIVNQ